MTPLPPSCTAPLVAVAALSARMLAQSARRAGLSAAALDVFGDRDTREASALWFDVAGDGVSIDRDRLVDALRRIARLPRVAGWVAGSGTEPFVDELAGLRGLPALIGNSPAARRAVREPRRFFALLDELGVPHPSVSFTRPGDADHDWLFKRADGCGGTHIVPAKQAPAELTASSAAAGYFQRRARGKPSSALFVAAGGTASVLGFAEELSMPIDGLPFVHTGAIGPIELPAARVAQLREAIGAICRRTGLVGINSCDFLLDDDGFSLLEINARPSATMSLYEAVWSQRWPRGLLDCHLAACMHAGLPAPPAGPAEQCAGQQVVFAPHALVVSLALSDALLADSRCRDIPMPGTRIAAGQPLCTVVARAPTPRAVLRALDEAHPRVLDRIDTLSHESRHVLTASHA